MSQTADQSRVDQSRVDHSRTHEVLAGFDPMSPGVQAEPYGFFREAHARCPVHHHTLSAADVAKISDNPLVAQPTTGFYSVFRYADVKSAAQNHELFSSATGPGPERLVAMNGVGMLVYADEPHHRLQRRIVNKVLSPRMVSMIEPRIREICHQLIDEIHADGRADMVAAFANALPGTVFSELLGVPPADRVQFKTWAEEIVAAFGGDPAAQARSVQTMGEVATYFFAIINSRRATLAEGGELPDDLITAMLVNDYEGRTFDDTEMILAIHIFLVGGHETTASGIGGTIYQLAVHPDQLDLLARDRSLVDNAVEEVLRYESPVQCMFRTPKNDTKIAGTPIATDEKVRLAFGAANRDPAVFENPDIFDVTRDPRGLRHHVGFGVGIHACVGAALARLEMRIALGALLERLGTWELDPERPNERGDSLLVRRFASLNIRWDPP
jgi:cytochrome P450